MNAGWEGEAINLVGLDNLSISGREKPLPVATARGDCHRVHADRLRQQNRMAVQREKE